MIFSRSGRRPGSAGFTLVEMVVVLVIIGVLAAIGIPSFLRSRREAQLDNRTRELVSMIALAQGEAVTGRELTGNVPNVAGRARQAGLRFLDEDTYLVFVDNDRDPADVEVVARVELSDAGGGGGGLGTSDQGYEVRIQDVTVGGASEAPPAGIEFRFESDATVANSDNVVINLVDPDLGRRSRIEVSVAGQASVTAERY